MKILINALSARKGGIITYTTNLMRAFDERGVDAVFALDEKSSFPKRPGDIRISVSNMSSFRRAMWEQTVWRGIVKKVKPDVLYSSANFGLLHSPVPQILLIREGGLFDPVYLQNVAPSLGVKAIVERTLRRNLIFACARSSDRVITPTEATRDLLRHWSQDIADKTTATPYGAPLARFGPSGPPRTWRSDGILKLLYVSFYYPHKQPGLISEAVRLLNERGIKTHLTLTTSFEEISSFPGGSKDVFLLEQAEKRGEVSLIGQVAYEELAQVYSEHDVFVSASLSETYGHPMVEAMLSGLPLVIADTPVSREVCGDGAVFFENTRAGSLVDRVLELDKSSDKRNQLCSTARTSAMDHCNWDTHVDTLLDIFNIAINGR